MKLGNWTPTEDEPEEDEWAFVHPEVPYVDVELPYVTDTLLDHNGDPLIELWNRDPCGFALPTPQHKELP